MGPGLGFGPPFGKACKAGAWRPLCWWGTEPGRVRAVEGGLHSPLACPSRSRIAPAGRLGASWTRCGLLAWLARSSARSGGRKVGLGKTFCQPWAPRGHLPTTQLRARVAHPASHRSPEHPRSREKGAQLLVQDSSLCEQLGKPFPVAGACHSLNAMVLDSPSITGADPSPVTWTCRQGKSQAGMGQVPMPRHKQAHACRPSLCLTCSKSSGRSSVASWALQRKEKEPSPDGGDLHPASLGRQVLMHPTRFSLGSWEQETLAMAWTIVHKAMGRMSPGGREQQEQGKAASLAGWWTLHQTGLPVQSTTVKMSRCGLFLGDRVRSRAMAGVGCLLVKPSTPDCPPLPLRQIQGSAVGARHVSLQASVARRCGATGAGARMSLWSSWGLRPTPAPPETPT